MPSRIQRQRTKGWRMPTGALYVGMPTKCRRGAVMELSAKSAPWTCSGTRCAVRALAAPSGRTRSSPHEL